MIKETSFSNKVVKQGTSLCVRIPYHIVKEQTLAEGDEVVMTLKKADYSKNEISDLLNIANKVKKLDKYSQLKKRIFLNMLFEYLNYTTWDEREDPKIIEKKLVDLFAKDFDSTLINEFTKFCDTFNKEAFDMDEGIAVLRKKYRRTR